MDGNKQKVLECMEKSKYPLRANEISIMTGINYTQVNNILNDLYESDKVYSDYTTQLGKVWHLVK